MYGTDRFLAGVIEGFYGQPWSPAERAELFEWMQRWGLNTYLYAPKDDLKHRTLWRELYSAQELEAIAGLVSACQARGIRFIYALGPGLDIRYENDSAVVQARVEQLLSVGCGDFALLFDDIPDSLDAADLKRFGSLASAQCGLANSCFDWLRSRRPDALLLFCPTAYCGRMREMELGGTDYLPTLGRELRPGIEVLWTGPEIVSREITPQHVLEIEGVLRRQPIIWDNLFANDYDGRRCFCGPYSGRTTEVRNSVRGLLLNPNTEFPLNYVPLRTFAQFMQEEAKWTPRGAWLGAMREWLDRFATVGQPIEPEDLILFGDCYYLPYEEGPEAQSLFEAGRSAEFRARAIRLRDFCAQVTELRDRALFYALSRRVWELREELDLLIRYLDFKAQDPVSPFRSPFHLPGTFRGGMVAKLQQVLKQNSDGTFIPARDKSHE